MKQAFVTLATLILLSAPEALSFAGSVTLPAPAGSPLIVGAQRPRELLLVVMSFDCQACRKSLPFLSRIQQLATPTIDMAGVIYPPEQQDLDKHARELHIDYPLFHGTPALAKRYGLKQTPLVLWFDRSGQIRERYAGEVRIRQLNECLAPGSRDRCSGIVEIRARPRDFLGKQVITSGMMQREDQGTGRRYFLSNGTERLEVEPWLPPESARPPQPGAEVRTPPSMQDLTGRFITVTGRIKAGPIVKVEQFSQQEAPKTWYDLMRRQR